MLRLAPTRFASLACHARLLKNACAARRLWLQWRRRVYGHLATIFAAAIAAAAIATAAIAAAAIAAAIATAAIATVSIISTATPA